jgi:hypothetical protein
MMRKFTVLVAEEQRLAIDKPQNSLSLLFI